MLQELEKRVTAFLDVVVEKHNITSYEDFTVPELRALAEEVEYFD